MQLKRITIFVALAFAPGAFAAETTTLPEVQVSANKLQPLPSLNNSGLDQNSLAHKRTNTSDTARLLDDQPGVSLYGAGGVSSLPVIHGLADDRVRVSVDGMDLISACANHMNPPLSYIDPANVGSVKVFAGITPVSAGGDSIGGTIQVNSAAPEFAQPGQGALLKGQAGANYRSNGNAKGGNLSATVASEKLSMTYDGSTTESGNYKAAKDFKVAGLAATGRSWLAGDEVGSSFYKSENQSLGFALRNENHLVELKLGFQHIPYQGFPSQHMDMTGNDSEQVNLRYQGQYQWGALEARAYHDDTRHKMNFAEDKNFYTLGMPMATQGNNTGLLVKADVGLSERDLLRVGGEYQRYRLNDWWDPVGTGGMSPDTFINIKDGQRDRYGIFAEWEARWNPEWISQLGVRSDTVKMDTGAVQGYKNTPTTGATYNGDRNAFNNADRSRTDNNIDLTALARYTPDERKNFEFGFAQKTRSPNLYERYTWSTGGMAMAMNNLVNDGNGYVGNLNLKPEVAHTFSFTAGWHDAKESWSLRAAPYLSYVDGFIDARRCPASASLSNNTTCTAATMQTKTNTFVDLQFVNQSARLYGMDISGHFPLAQSQSFGSFTFNGLLNYVRGVNRDTGDNLYNMMPINARLSAVQKLGGWTNTLEWQLVAAKRDVNWVRNEMQTSGYGLANLHGSYEWKQARLDIGIENLFNKFYSLPLGGAYIGQGSTMSLNGAGAPWGISVPGMGRSINAGMTVKF